jgi:hypothetical protein
MNLKIALCIIFFISTLPSKSLCDDFYIFTSTFKTQEEAQKKAAIVGTWVLNTNFYPKLTPGLFSVVHGPYSSRLSAKNAWHKLSKRRAYKDIQDVYIKNAGEINVENGIKKLNIPLKLVVALLGELNLSLSHYNKAGHPCLPREPFDIIDVKHFKLSAEGSPEHPKKINFVPFIRPVRMGAIYATKSDGAVGISRICIE